MSLLILLTFRIIAVLTLQHFKHESSMGYESLYEKFHRSLSFTLLLYLHMVHIIVLVIWLIELKVVQYV